MKYVTVTFIAVLSVMAVWYWGDIIGLLSRLYHFLEDEQRVRVFVDSYGTAAPAVFISLQILQVLLAPIPGEVSGVIGGYIFGAGLGFIYSSIGLSVGSWLNFFIGRILGRHWVRKLIPQKQLIKFDKIAHSQGPIVLFFLFIFPGFPKDFLCLFLGLTSLPTKIFLIIASFGRMPGTLMLSLQGASLFDRNYRLLLVLVLVCCLLAIASWVYREPVGRWIDKMNGNDSK